MCRNKPYAGGFITEHYGNPAAGLHAIQLEINRGLYMDERRYARSTRSALRRRSGDVGDGGWARSAGGTAALPGGGGITEKKKGRSRMSKRPKSREETPKEGNDSSRYRIAINYTATHKNQGWQAHIPCFLRIAKPWNGYR